MADYTSIHSGQDIDTGITNIGTHIVNVSNPHQVTKAQVGLGLVDNTADVDKPLSTAVSLQLATKQDNISVEKGIEMSGATIGLKQAFYDYLDNATYAKPTIASFNIQNSSGTNVNGDYELGSTVTVAQISHNETNPDSVNGSLYIKNGSTSLQTCAATSTVTTVALDTAQDVTATTTFTLSGTDTKGNALSSSKAINFYRYAYTTVNSSATAPTSGLTKRTAESTFATNGCDITYAVGDYIYLYSTTSGKSVATNVMGTWATVDFTELSATTITQANGTTYTYYPYRVGPMVGAGTAKYRV